MSPCNRIHSPNRNPCSTNHPAYDTTYTAAGTNRSEITTPNPSDCTALHNGRPTPNRLRRVRSHTKQRSTAVAIPVIPDHLVAIADPNATPAANRQGRNSGSGNRRRTSAGAGAEGAPEPPASPSEAKAFDPDPDAASCEYAPAAPA